MGFQYSERFRLLLNLYSALHKHVKIKLSNRVTNGHTPKENLSFEQIKFKFIRAKEYLDFLYSNVDNNYSNYYYYPPPPLLTPPPPPPPQPPLPPLLLLLLNY